MRYTGWRGCENMGYLVYVGYMTNDGGCRGASNSLFVVQRDEREYEYAERCTFLICRTAQMISRQKSCSCTERYLRGRV